MHAARCVSNAGPRVLRSELPLVVSLLPPPFFPQSSLTPSTDVTDRWWVKGLPLNASDWRSSVLSTRLYHTLRLRVGLPVDILSLIRAQAIGVLDVCQVADWRFGGGAEERQLKQAVELGLTSQMPHHAPPPS